MKPNTDKEIINSLSVKHRLNPEVIESIVNHGLKCIKECMTMEDMPNILIHNWGRFKPSKGSMDNRFYHSVRKLDKNPDEELDWYTLEYMVKAYDRVIKEENLQSSVGADKIREIIKIRSSKDERERK